MNSQPTMKSNKKITNRKITRKSQNTWKLNNIPLNKHIQKSKTSGEISK